MLIHPTTGVRTIMFVEEECDKNRMVIGYRLNRDNYRHAPRGIIRIAKFTSAFSPRNNLGYYNEVHLHLMIRKWKRRRQISQWKLIAAEKNLCDDIEKVVIDFL